MKKGFTLLELMVVIGIIAILATILLRTVGGSSESARAAKCLAHMHNLAAACHSVAMTDSYYPAAGSRECRHRTRQTRRGGSGSGLREYFTESAGWVSWFSKDAYPLHVNTATRQRSRYATSHTANSSWFISTYTSDHDKWYYCLTNGAIWRAANASESSYVCPLHQVCAKKWNLIPHWSYVMNSAFGADDSIGAKAHNSSGRRGFAGFKKTDRMLLFAELPFNEENTSQTVKHTATAGTEFDPTLQYPNDGSSRNEVIGFNHKSKRKWHAHVCFADGHTEKLEMPSDTSTARFRELTEWLCTAEDISFNGTRYEEVK